MPTQIKLNITGWEDIPDNLLSGLIRYQQGHCPVGDFLRCVLSNDLRGAVGHADSYSRAALCRVVQFCHNEMRGDCWGSKAKYEAWIEPVSSI